MKSDKRVKAFAYLHDLAIEIQQYDFQAVELLRYILRSLEETMGFQHSQVLLLHPDKDKLYHVSGRGVCAVAGLDEITIGHGIIGMAVKRGKAIRINNIGSIVRYSQAIMGRMESDRPEAAAHMQPHSQMQSQIAVPLKIKGGTIGALSVESESANAFDDADEEMLAIMAMHIAHVVIEIRTPDQMKGTALDLNRLPEPGVLSGRELEVARLAAQGLSNGEISSRLILSQRTITTHLERIYRKLDIHSRNALIHYFSEHYGLKSNE